MVLKVCEVELGMVWGKDLEGGKPTRGSEHRKTFVFVLSARINENTVCLPVSTFTVLYRFVSEAGSELDRFSVFVWIHFSPVFVR